eukprot:gene38423-42876_t
MECAAQTAVDERGFAVFLDTEQQGQVAVDLRSGATVGDLRRIAAAKLRLHIGCTCLRF